MNYFFRLFFFLLTTTCFGQFNTLTYTYQEKENKEFLNESFPSATQNEIPQKQVTKPKKKRLFTTKADLKKELDSLKTLIIDLGKKENDKKLNFKKIEDSLIQNFQNKIAKKEPETNHKNIKKYNFISENTIKKIAMPLDKMLITSPFGVRYHPIFGGQKMHNGIDLGANYENVYTVLDGVVSEAGWDKNGGGNYIKVRHSNRFETSYLHLSQIYYRTGEVVKAGYIIGKSGNSGNSTGPHLHFAVKEYGKFINPTQFLNALRKEKIKAGVVIVDEGHLLLTAKNQAYLGGNHLIDLLAQSKVVVLVYDDKQIMNKSQIWTDNTFFELEHEANLEGNLIELRNQMRIKANPETVNWIRSIIDDCEIKKLTKDKQYDIRIFDSPFELQKAIKLKNKDQKLGISRLVATYDWTYVEEKKKQDRPKWFVEIGDWKAPWNQQIKPEKKDAKLSWIEQPQTIDEIGSTFTVQGFDLNYAGVIIGPSVKYRNGKIMFDISESKNKGAVQNRKLENGEMKNFGEDLLKNELNVLLTRGVNGLYIYAVDEELQEALKEAIL